MAIEIRPDLPDKIQRTARSREELYSSHATKDTEYLRRKQKKSEEPSIRPPFFRDADRIIHSRAYSRYIDKTQVFFLVDNDHVTHRVLHVQLVSKVARTIGRALKLNEDLIEAISLGHDIGHVPCGHLGEKVLSDICEEKGMRMFLHNVQSIQFLDAIEDLDLTLQVLDGILCHNGEVHGKSLVPEDVVSWDFFEGKIDAITKGQDRLPSTLEGCVVRVADTIAYLGRDLQDALEVNLTDDTVLKEFPKNCRNLFDIEGSTKEDFKSINQLVLDRLVKDVINNSYEKGRVSFSEEVSGCVDAFYEFNKKRIYENPKLLRESRKIETMYRTLFEEFLRDLNTGNVESRIYPDMMNLRWISTEYLKRSTHYEIVRDYIAGMTDRYFEDRFKQIINPIPERVKVHYS